MAAERVARRRPGLLVREPVQRHPEPLRVLEQEQVQVRERRLQAHSPRRAVLAQAVLERSAQVPGVRRERLLGLQAPWLPVPERQQPVRHAALALGPPVSRPRRA